MFELIFGGAFTFMAMLFTVVLLGVGLFGGEPAFLLALLGLLPFWVIGIVCLKKGLRQRRIDKETKKFGRDTFGLVVEFTGSGCYVNGYPVWDVHVLVDLGNGSSRMFVTEAGTQPAYDIGDFLSVKYYQGDINILERVSRYSVPEPIKNYLLSVAPTSTAIAQAQQQQKPQDFIVTEDTIVVDGVAYPRPK